MDVRVNEAGQDVEAAGVHLPVRGQVQGQREGDDGPIAHGEVGHAGFGDRAVGHGAAAQEQVAARGIVAGVRHGGG